MGTNDRIHRIAAIAGGIATALWVAFYGWYISTSLGFENLTVLPPDQVAGIIFALVLPPVLIWVLIAYWTRGRELARQTDRVNAALERLTISDNQATKRVSDLAGALKQQSAELERASTQAAEVVDRIRAQFKDQTAELESAAKAAEAEAAAIDVRLGQQRLNLGDLAKTVAQQKDLLVDVAANQAKAIENAAADAARHVSDAFAAKQPEMEAVVDRILEHGGVV
jgi:methyl-accepting chemotaxis protein